MVTVIHPDDHLAQHVGVAGLIGGTVGASVRSLGGLGAFASISVRGASSGHTAVIIDGVPLARVGTVSADLGRFDAMSYDQIDLYRGAVPIELAGAGLGGALTLTTRLGPTAQGDRLLLSLGGGSLMARHARLRWGEALGAAGPAQLAAVVTAGYRGARGDFAYYDNGGTTLDASDDTFQRRANNAFDEADVAARIGRLDGTRALGVRLVGKRQGLPGRDRRRDDAGRAGHCRTAARRQRGRRGPRPPGRTAPRLPQRRGPALR
jgi:vitamin B12 transporter